MPTSPPVRSLPRAPVLILLLALAATLVVYGLTLQNELVFDDSALEDGTIFGGYGKLVLQARMLSYGSFVWLDQVAGGNMVVQRMANVLLHLATCAAIWLLLRELMAQVQWPQESLEKPGFSARQKLGTALAVGLFAVHPVAVYAVAYLVQRSIVMATLFAALACMAFVRALARNSWGWGLAALLATALALMSKEHAVALPLLALPLYIFVKRPNLRGSATFAAASLLLVGLLAALMWNRFGHIVGSSAFDELSRAYLLQLETARPGISSHVWGLSIFNQAGLFLRYGLLWWLPNVQWIAIDLRPPFPMSFAAMPQLLLAAGFAGLAAFGLAALFRGRGAWRLAGLCIVCAQLLFVTEFVTTWLQDPFVLYRSYLWAMWTVPLFALVLLALPTRVLLPLGCALIVGFASLAAERASTFTNSNTVWTDAISKIDKQAPFNAFGRWRPYLSRGTYALLRNDDQQALGDFNAAVTLQEPLGSAQFSRGMALQLLGQHEEAAKAFDAAQAQGFDKPELDLQRAENSKATQDFESAHRHYIRVLELRHISDDARQAAQLGQAQMALATGRTQEAVRSYKKLLESAPRNARYQVELASAYIQAGDHPEARKWLDRSIAIHPTAPAYYSLAIISQQRGNRAAAIENLQRASQLAPDNALYQQLLQRLSRPAAPQATPAPRVPYAQ